MTQLKLKEPKLQPPLQSSFIGSGNLSCYIHKIGQISIILHDLTPRDIINVWESCRLGLIWLVCCV